MSDFESVTIDLPYPPSVNRCWRIFRNRAVLSAEATAYKRVAKGTAVDQMMASLSSPGLDGASCTAIPKRLPRGHCLPQMPRHAPGHPAGALAAGRWRHSWTVMAMGLMTGLA